MKYFILNEKLDEQKLLESYSENNPLLDSFVIEQDDNDERFFRIFGTYLDQQESFNKELGRIENITLFKPFEMRIWIDDTSLSNPVMFLDGETKIISSFKKGMKDLIVKPSMIFLEPDEEDTIISLKGTNHIAKIVSYDNIKDDNESLEIFSKTKIKIETKDREPLTITKNSIGGDEFFILGNVDYIFKNRIKFTN